MKFNNNKNASNIFVRNFMYGKILAKQLWTSTVPFQTTWVEQMMMIKKARKKKSGVVFLQT